MKAVLERNLGFIGYPDYSVDTDGNAWSHPRKTRSGIRQLKPKTRPNGYQYVNLCHNGEFIKEWKSSVEVEKALHINRRHITRCARGQRKSAGGFIWKYKEEG